MEGESAARKKAVMVQIENIMHHPFEKTSEIKVHAQTSVRHVCGPCSYFC